MSLKNAVAEVSREEGTSINQFVNVAIAEKLAALRTERFFAERAPWPMWMQRSASCLGMAGNLRTRKTGCRRSAKANESR